MIEELRIFQKAIKRRGAGKDKKEEGKLRYVQAGLHLYAVINNLKL